MTDPKTHQAQQGNADQSGADQAYQGKSGVEQSGQAAQHAKGGLEEGSTLKRKRAKLTGPLTGYPFEVDSGSHRSPGETEENKTILIERLGLTPADIGRSDPTEELGRHLGRFANQIILNIAWYDRRLKREKANHAYWRAATVVIIVSVVLLVAAVPFIVQWLGMDQMGDGGQVVAQLTGALAGVLGAHRSLNTFMTGRKLAAIFHKASSDLKDLLYGFEDEWRGRVLLCVDDSDPGTIDPKFYKAVRQVIAAGKVVTREEQTKYFANMEGNDTPDIGKEFANAAQNADKLLGGTLQKTFAADEGAVAEQNALAAGARIRELNALLDSTLERIKALGDSSDPSAEGESKALQKRVESLRNKINDAEIERAEAAAVLRQHGET